MFTGKIAKSLLSFESLADSLIARDSPHCSHRAGMLDGKRYYTAFPAEKPEKQSRMRTLLFGKIAKGISATD